MKNQFQYLKALGLLEIDPNKFHTTGDATFSFEDESVGQFHTFQNDYDSASDLMQFPIQSGTKFENGGLTNETGKYLCPFTVVICRHIYTDCLF